EPEAQVKARDFGYGARILHPHQINDEWGTRRRGYTRGVAICGIAVEMGRRGSMKNRTPKLIVGAAIVAFLAASCSMPASAQDEGAWSDKKPAWVLLSAPQRAQALEFAEDYKSYMNVARSALTSTREVIRRAKAAGFTELTSPAQVKAGARLIIPDRDRALVLAIIGTDPIVDGSRVIGTHHDSPHIELKGRPIVAAEGFALFKTISYGGIK